MYLLGIDLGTTGCKSMVFSIDGDILGSDYIEYDLIITNEGYIEQNANDWWNNICRSIKNTIKNNGIRGKDITALSVSSQGISFVPVDKAGNPMMNAISWLDGRAAQEAKAISGIYGTEHYFSITGKLILPSYVMPKLIWIKKHFPEIYNNTWKFMMGHDYLLYRFAGKAVTDYSMATGTLCYDITQKSWFSEVLERFGIDKEKLPELGCLGDCVGNVLPDVAEELGLSPGALVIMGAQDQRCASIGAGIDEKSVTVSLGTATAVCSICTEPLFDKYMKVTCCGLDENHWMLESVIATSGVALKWMKSNFFANMSYKDMDNLALTAPIGSNGIKFYPHLSNKGSGANGTLTGIGLHSTQGDVARAVLEGISFLIRMHIEDHERIKGQIEQVRLFGGGASSTVWAQMISDITGKTVIIPKTHETATLGAAIIAGIGSGQYKNYQEAIKMQGNASLIFTSNCSNHISYSSLYQNYLELNEKIYNQ